MALRPASEAARSADPVVRLEHDHAHLSRRVAHLRDVLASSSASEPLPAEIARELVALSDDLFEHFAREEEGFFPFVVAHVPELAEDVARLVTAHDRICGAAARLLAMGQRGAKAQGASVDLTRALFERFEAAYGEHAGAENEFLRAISAKLGPEHRAELDDILKSL